MKSRKTNKTNWEDLCGQLGEDDGIPPRRKKSRREQRHEKPHRKTLQLCGQVAHVLEAVLTGECRDEDLQRLQVVSVVPAPHSGRMAVTVQVEHLKSPADIAAIQAKLNFVTPWLRTEVAESITRRKAPELTFVVTCVQEA